MTKGIMPGIHASQMMMLSDEPQPTWGAFDIAVDLVDVSYTYETESISDNPSLFSFSSIDYS